MARLFADENFPAPVVDLLRSFGHDVLTVYGLGFANQEWPDEDVMLYAISEQRIILTNNRKDFFRLHRRFPAHYGIIACTVDPDFSGVATRIQQALADQRPRRGEVIRINQPSR